MYGSAWGEFEFDLIHLLGNPLGNPRGTTVGNPLGTPLGNRLADPLVARPGSPSEFRADFEMSAADFFLFALLFEVLKLCSLDP